MNTKEDRMSADELKTSAAELDALISKLEGSADIVAANGMDELAKISRDYIRVLKVRLSILKESICVAGAESSASCTP